MAATSLGAVASGNPENARLRAAMILSARREIPDRAALLAAFRDAYLIVPYITDGSFDEEGNPSYMISIDRADPADRTFITFSSLAAFASCGAAADKPFAVVRGAYLERLAPMSGIRGAFVDPEGPAPGAIVAFGDISDVDDDVAALTLHERAYDRDLLHFYAPEVSGDLLGCARTLITMTPDITSAAFVGAHADERHQDETWLVIRGDIDDGRLQQIATDLDQLLRERLLGDVAINLVLDDTTLNIPVDLVRRVDVGETI